MIESTLVVPSIFVYSLIKPAFGSCYGLIRYKWFSKLQFKSLRIKLDLFDEYYRETCGIAKKNMIAFLQANSRYSLNHSIKNCSAKICIYVGDKENDAMKISARRLHETMTGSSMKILTHMYHGDFSINNVSRYVKEIYELVKR